LKKQVLQHLSKRSAQIGQRRHQPLARFPDQQRHTGRRFDATDNVCLPFTNKDQTGAEKETI
jgi:hypothetical protein